MLYCMRREEVTYTGFLPERGRVCDDLRDALLDGSTVSVEREGGEGE